MAGQTDGQTDGRTDGWMDGWTDRFPLCSTGLHLLRGRCPKRTTTGLWSEISYKPSPKIKQFVTLSSCYRVYLQVLCICHFNFSFPLYWGWGEVLLSTSLVFALFSFLSFLFNCAVFFPSQTRESIWSSSRLSPSFSFLFISLYYYLDNECTHTWKKKIHQLWISAAYRWVEWDKVASGVFSPSGWDLMDFVGGWSGIKWR